MDDTSVALLIVYPTDHPIANKVLQVPITLAKDTHLQAALVPWELTSKEFGSTNWKQRVPTIETALDPKLVPVLDARGREVVTKRRFHQALHILRIPRAVFDYVSLIPRPYCIWTGPTDTTSTSASYETSLLKEFLSTCKGKDMGHKADVRVIFVHVGGLATLHLLPALAERRMKTAVRFLTYGTHPGVPRERWGVREIYPLGSFPRWLLLDVLLTFSDVLHRRRRYVHARCYHRRPPSALQPHQADRGAPDVGVLCVAIGRGDGRKTHLSRTTSVTCL